MSVPIQEYSPDNRILNCRIYLLSLGCAKNLVDSECMTKLLTDAGGQMTGSPDTADVLIVNTCGFIESAKREAIQAILNLTDYKIPDGPARFLIVTGCLAQRYVREIGSDLPEVDAVLGTSAYGQIVETILSLYKGPQNGEPIALSMVPGSISHLAVAREPSTNGHYAYIKIAEGCSNCCTYCAIPGIRGPFHSRPLPEVVAEADRLSRSGRDELILIAQDTTRYGLDLDGRRQLVPLLKAICRLDAVRMVRILYAYAEGLSDELIDYMAAEPKIAQYLDLPIQHASDHILAAMNRRDTAASLRQVISKLRQAMPGLILRTTVMVGFPGESDADFDKLMEFLKEIRFERLGCFIFSPEEGTPAFSLKPRIGRLVARHRQKRVMEQQKMITEAANRRRIGEVVTVTLESIDDRGIFFIGRSFGEAPDVDPVVYVAATTENLSVGQTCPVRLVDAGEYDMTGVTEF
jgi:ribosomal protein S12 methylthiotransferase